MSIIRNHINFSSNFVQIPNEWMRDGRLSHRARGILAEVMTHSDGWEITVQHLVRNGTEGREAVRTAIKELVQFGYLRQERVQDESGKMLGSQYVIQVPPEDRETTDRATGNWAAGSPGPRQSPTKNTNLKEDQILEHYPPADAAVESDSTEPSVDTVTPDKYHGFDDFWDAYPRKIRKKVARERWAAAIKRETPEAITRAAQVYARDCKANQREDKFIKYPEGWLTADSWNDYTEANMPKLTTVSLSWADAL